MMPKVFVGTMSCGENELEQCVEAVSRQQDVVITHFRVDNKPELDAHHTLYSAWNDAKNDYDAFIQVDADTVLLNDNMLREMFDELTAKKLSGYTSIQAPLLDFLTDSMIYGLNCYSTEVEFYVASDKLYCDRATKNNKTYVIPTTKQTKLCPAGTHSPNPSLKQCFHFGVHRALKNQHEKKRLILNAYNKLGSQQRGYALIGFYLAKKIHSSFNYTDVEFNELFAHVENNYTQLVKDATR